MGCNVELPTTFVKLYAIDGDYTSTRNASVECVPSISEQISVESVPYTSNQTPGESVPSTSELTVECVPSTSDQTPVESVPSTSDQTTVECVLTNSDQTPVESVPSTSDHTPVESVSCKYPTTQNTSCSHTTLTCTAKDDDFPLSCVFVKSKLCQAIAKCIGETEVKQLQWRWDLASKALAVARISLKLRWP